MNKRKNVCALLLLVLVLAIRPQNVLAGEATVTFGSDSYTTTNGAEFNVGIYIKTEESLGAYYVELEYDTNRLHYVSGGDEENQGIITLEGTGFGDSIRYWLTFEAIGGGDAGIAVHSAQVHGSTTDGGAALEVEELAYAPIHINGTDAVGTSFEQQLAEKSATEETDGIESRYPVLGTLQQNGQTLYLLDHSAYIPDTVGWQYSLTQAEYQGIEAQFLCDVGKRYYILYLLDENEQVKPYIVQLESQKVYELIEGTDETGRGVLYGTALACSRLPNEITEDIIRENQLVYGICQDGTGQFYQVDLDGVLHPWSVDSLAEEAAPVIANETILLISLCVAGFIIIGAWAILMIERARLHRKDKKGTLVVETFDDDFPDVKEPEDDRDKTVISVQNVTMKFKVSTSDASGLKEFLIQKIKKQVSYRELLALNDVSFDVYRGEVVGIIGTNGSGKSTLLKIVSGALRPTSGCVEVDRRKIQLLTLGTGFDTELTARENVYLNGAIIGYSKKFLDDHYEEIVEFAELEGFMEEKVKNFSSGMVSRLGFAIATAGDAAEILILDEVLSVGDEFFRKKSLARVQEMIHGGSTVLMVSHSMDTIRDNCTKVIWIEKGALQAVGEAKSVCKEYQMRGNAS